MKDYLKSLIIGISIVCSVLILSFAITYYGRSKDTISVTGLGETTFVSDMIVWQGRLVVDNYDKLAGYRALERNQQIVAKYLKDNGIEDSEIVFNNVSCDKQFTSIYEDGNYAGSRFVGYMLSQEFTITSNDVEKVEQISRNISTLIAQNVDVESYSPEYYYTHLDDLKLELIEKASKDAHARAKNIVKNAGARLGKASSARLGVFQITDATGSEEYSYGGAFNTSSKEKKARITVRMEYKLK